MHACSYNDINITFCFTMGISLAQLHSFLTHYTSSKQFCDYYISATHGCGCLHDCCWHHICVCSKVWKNFNWMGKPTISLNTQYGNNGFYMPHSSIACIIIVISLCFLMLCMVLKLACSCYASFISDDNCSWYCCWSLVTQSECMSNGIACNAYTCNKEMHNGSTLQLVIINC